MWQSVMRDNLHEISIIVPTLNESGNVEALVSRIDRALRLNDISYELIFIDDHSRDATVDILKKLSEKYPIHVHLKRGSRGKGYSIVEGFGYATKALTGVIDADLQYPPEALPEMIKKIESGEADFVIAHRDEKNLNIIRKIFSKGFRFFFGRLLHGLRFDVQSGLKVLRTQIAKEISIDPSPWAWDLELTLGARDAGWKLGWVKILFAERTAGQSKLNVLKASKEIGWNAIKMKFRRKAPTHIPSHHEETMTGAGISHKGKRFITHSTLAHHVTAIQTFTLWQKSIFIFIVICVAMGFFIAPMTTAIALTAILSAIYFSDVLFNLYVVARSLTTRPEIHYTQEELENLDESNLPVYTVLCPLYREAHILPGFLEAISKMNWPKEKLDVLLLLEEDDQTTIEAARNMDLPPYVRILVVPHSMPKTKPKACNYGLNFARGEYLVIYDAEDIPDPEQLKKAYLGFQSVPETVKCLQAKLNYHNPHDNMLTRFFTAEYSLWFDVTLTGLQSINTSLPLGGTSNHFRTKDLFALEGWDPFNVTEDCDLGVRLFKRGYTTAIIDSVTLEEANSNLRNWLRQRSRWIKGYMQTYLVHMRNPFRFVKDHGIHAFVFQLIVGGKIAFMLINPFLWIATISYFALYSIVGPTIEALYPPIIFYMAASSLVFGNFLCLYYYMIGCAKRGHWSLIKYVFFVPFYWLAASAAAYIAFYQLLVKPHYWEKTNHGLHLLKQQSSQPKPAQTPSKPVPARKPAPITTPKPAYSLASITKTEAVKSEPQIIPHSAGKITSQTPKSPAIEKIQTTQKHSTSFFKKLSGSLLSKSGILIGALMVSNVLNFLYNAYLGRVMPLEELGLVTLINTLWSVFILFINPLSSTVNNRSAYLVAAGKKEDASLFYRSVYRRGIFIASVVSVLWIISIPIISTFFNTADQQMFLLFTPVFVFGVMAAAARGLLNGNLFFVLIGVLYIVEAITKFATAILFTSFGLHHFVFMAVPLSVATTALVATFWARKIVGSVPATKDFAFPGKFYTASLFTSAASVVFLSVDIILVKHYLSPEQAGAYALLALVGKMIYFFGALPNAFMMTFVSRDQGLGRSTKKTFNLLFGSTLGLVITGFFGLGILGSQTVPILLGEKTLIIIPYLLLYTLAISFFTLSNSIVSYHLAKKHYIFPVLSLVSSLAMSTGIFFFHSSIRHVVTVMYSVSAISFAVFVALNYAYRYLASAQQGVRDFFGLFASAKELSLEPEGNSKRILIFNWRDTRHMYAGGAEIYTHEIAAHWARAGHHVTLFCGNDGKSPRSEVIDGVHIIRRGGFYFVYVWAFIYYVFRLRKSFDIIVDCQNGIPFFTPLYSNKPIYCLMHHVHQEVFYRSLPKPLALFACFLEKRLMPIAYKHVPFITVSESSKKAILQLGLAHAGITVVHPGIHIDQLDQGKKTSYPSILYLGRLKKYKSIDILIRAFAEVVKSAPDARLVIAGSGEEENKLKRLAAHLKLTHAIEFAGKVTEERKIKLYQESWVMVNPSLMEGWGLTTIEANACGTPIIASDVPGLRDSVNMPEAGYLVPYGDVHAFAEKILVIIQNKSLRERMSEHAITWSKKFDWQESAKKFSKILGTA